MTSPGSDADAGDALHAAADELYGLPPGDFTARRNALAAQAKADGDREAAAQIAQLRKPVMAAFLVNLLVREEPEQIAALVDLGAAMRRAQTRLSADDLRRLGAQRQQVVRALASQAHALAGELGAKPSRDALHQVGDTLQAALADPELADQVRAGRLSAPLSYAGFGPAGLQLVREAEPASSAPVEDEQARARERAREQAKAEVDLAARAVVTANRALATAKDAAARADRDLARAEQVLAERQAALEEAARTQQWARDKVASCTESHAQAGQAQRQAVAALTEAKRTLAELE
ncbi:MAG: hypothetical protein ACK5MT_12880 [Actinomycetales bacterium]